MLSTNQNNDVLQDMMLLYELSLQTGRTLDFHENIDNFIKLLLHRKSLTSASLWLKASTIKRSSLTLLPIKTHDADWIRMINYPIKEIHKQQTALVEHFLSYSSDEDIYSFVVEKPYVIHETINIKEGTYFFYRLDNFGFIKLYSSIPNDEKINKKAVKKLRVVFDHFKNSIIASLNQLKLEIEIDKSKSMSNEVLMTAKFPQQNPYPVLRFTKDVELLYFNAPAERIKGHFLDLKWAYATMFSKTLNTNEMKVYEQVIDGKFYSFTVKPIPEYGYVNIYGMDITSRKSIEYKLKEEKDKAEKLARVKMEFLSTMSHEIRTPMNSIIGSLNLLKDTTLDDYQSKKLKMMRFAADNLLRLINEILDFNKLEANKVSLERIRFPLIETMENLFAMHTDNAEDKNISLNLNLEKVPVNYIIGDPTRLSQILLNLISNAIKFTDKGGVDITVTSTFKNKKSVVYQFSVKDSGIGISQDRIDNIFEAFTQEDSSTTRKFGGTGLGLSITKKLVDLLEGSLEVDSNVGEGTNFIVTLPYEIAANQNDEEEDWNQGEITRIENLNGVSVLLVDDNDFNILIASEFLKRWDATLYVAKNGEEALDQLKRTKQQIDIVLMDLQMPVMDGFEATKIIRSFEEDYYQELPIIALTADVASEEVFSLDQKGFDDFASKPFEPDSLLQKLIKHIQKKNIKS
ncbi:ATP-binding protein [Flammeovirga agarivorans]|uniref:histidine kinase n=1 Tax=Flammeovirga agarivorans TaxID=2726742 RepID=A0A7X8SID1_9BACT|nr:ATP-binding protein [Flammeovirga agarivorans]NLR90764.1 response regulator [Flammeovirga agarivorans]